MIFVTLTKVFSMAGNVLNECCFWNSLLEHSEEFKLVENVFILFIESYPFVARELKSVLI